MEILHRLMISESGMIFSACLLFTGITDIILTSLIFDSQLRQIKRRKEIFVEPGTEEEIDKRIRGLQISSNTMYILGIVLTSMGLYTLMVNFMNN